MLAPILAFSLLFLPNLLLPINAEAAFPIPQASNGVFFTIRPDSKLTEGPILTTDNGTDYFTHVFRLIVKGADESASHYENEGHPKAYWAFMAAALVFPFHESRLQHFRQSNGSLCTDGMNTGEALKGKSHSLYDLFKQYMDGPEHPIVQDCSLFRSSDSVLQLLGSYDRLSTGIMQITGEIYPHTITSGNFLRVGDTIRDGLNIYKTGFDRAFNNPKNYPCLTSQLKPRYKLNYDALVRGSWSVYNGGRSKFCRYTNKHDEWHVNDIGFFEDYDLVISGTRKDDRGHITESYFERFLQGDDLAAYHEIIHNFTKGRNFSVNTNRVLTLPSENPQHIADGAQNTNDGVTNTTIHGLTVYLNQNTNVYSVPSDKETNILVNKLKGAPVELISENRGWSKIRLSESDTASLDLYQTSIKGDGSVYVKSEVLDNWNKEIISGQVINAQALHIRSSAPSGPIVGVLTTGKDFTILEVKYFYGASDPKNARPWFRIGVDRWVYGGYVDVTNHGKSTASK